MKKTIGSYEFVNDMMAIREHNFSREALFALYDYFEELEDGCNIEIEFDPIAICCEYTENTLQNICEIYAIMVSDTDEAMEYLRDRTDVIDLGNGNIIIKNF